MFCEEPLRGPPPLCYQNNLPPLCTLKTHTLFTIIKNQKSFNCSPLSFKARRRGLRHGQRRRVPATRLTYQTLSVQTGAAWARCPNLKRGRNQRQVSNNVFVFPCLLVLGHTPCIKSFMHTTRISHQLLECKPHVRRREC